MMKITKELIAEITTLRQDRDGSIPLFAAMVGKKRGIVYYWLSGEQKPDKTSVMLLKIYKKHPAIRQKALQDAIKEVFE